MKILSALLLALSMSVSATPPSIPDNQWTQLPQAAGVPVQIPGWESAVYASSIDRTIFWGGYHINSSEIQNAILAYSFTDNRWDILDITHQFFTEFLPTEGHDFGGMTYNSAEDIWVFPFVKQMLPGQNFTYVYDFKAMAGRRMQPRKQCLLWANRAGAYDIKNNRTLIFGGDVWGSPVAATWRYQYSSNTWLNLTPPAQPSARSNSAMVYDSAHNIVVLYGGSTGNSETWWYYPDSNKWVQKYPTGDSPGAQSEHAMVYMSASGKVLLKGREGNLGTWIYDASQNTWTAVANANTPTYARFWTLSYDSKNDVCLWISAGGSYSGGWPYAGKMVAFRYNGGAGKRLAAPAEKALQAQAPASNLISQTSLNTDTTAWAFTPDMISDGSNLYVGWSEFSTPATATSRSFRVKKWDGVTWTPLGAHVAADNQEEMAPVLALSAGNVLHQAFIKHTLWSGDSLMVLKWQSNAWTPVGGAPADTASMVANNPRLALLGENPYVAWLEMDQRANLYPPRHALFVKHFNGTGWQTDSLAGRDYFNRFQVAGAQAQSVNLAVSPDQLVYLAWDEFVTDDQNCTPNWVFVMRKTGAGAWERLGGALNSDSLNRWATYPSISFLGNDPVVAYNERTETGLNQLLVKRWNGSAWQLLGGSLNVNADSGHAYHPCLRTYQGTLYAAFCEFRKGDRVKGYLKRWNGSSWIPASAPCNVDPLKGSAADLSVAFMNQKAYLAWSEQTFPGFRQIYAAEADSAAQALTKAQRSLWPGALSISPNPFHAGSTITVRFPDGMNASTGARLAVYDMKGALVDRFATGRSTRLAWRPEGLGAGLYLFKLETGDKAWVKRAMLLK